MNGADRARAAVAPQRTLTALAVLAMAAGIVARLASYLAARSFWYDEAAVAVNVLTRSFGELAWPLNFMQSAPPLFLWSTRAAVLVSGADERVFRFLPLVSGVAVLPLVCLLARRILAPAGALAAVALVSFAPLLIRYSDELKPYGVDAFVSAALMLLTVRVAEAPSDRRRWLALGAAGVAAALLSIPAMLVFAGVCLYLAATPGIRDDGAGRRRLAVAGAAWALVSVALLATVYRSVSSTSSDVGHFMHSFWSDYFLRGDDLAGRAGRILRGATRDTFLGESWPLPGGRWALVALGALGTIGIATRGPARVLLLLLAPLAALLAAGALGKYPLHPRLILFASPITAILIAAGIERIAAVLSERRRPAAVLALTALLVAWPARLAARDVVRPRRFQETRDLVRAASSESREGPGVWVSGGASAAWYFYSTQPDGPSTTRGLGDRRDAPLLPWEPPPGVVIGRWLGRRDTPESWIASEWPRIESVMRPCALVLIANSTGPERREITRKAEATGARIARVRRREGAVLLDVCHDDRAAPVPLGAARRPS